MVRSNDRHHADVTNTTFRPKKTKKKLKLVAGARFYLIYRTFVPLKGCSLTPCTICFWEQQSSSLENCGLDGISLLQMI